MNYILDCTAPTRFIIDQIKPIQSKLEKKIYINTTSPRLQRGVELICCSALAAAIQPLATPLPILLTGVFLTNELVNRYEPLIALQKENESLRYLITALEAVDMADSKKPLCMFFEKKHPKDLDGKLDKIIGLITRSLENSQIVIARELLENIMGALNKIVKTRNLRKFVPIDVNKSKKEQVIAHEEGLTELSI